MNTRLYTTRAERVQRNIRKAVKLLHDGGDLKEVNEALAREAVLLLELTTCMKYDEEGLTDQGGTEA